MKLFQVNRSAENENVIRFLADVVYEDDDVIEVIDHTGWKTTFAKADVTAVFDCGRVTNSRMASHWIDTGRLR